MESAAPVWTPSQGNFFGYSATPQQNLAVAGTPNIVYTGAGAGTLGGVNLSDAREGTELTVANTGGGNLTVVNQDAGSTAGFRFRNGISGGNVTIPPGGSAKWIKGPATFLSGDWLQVA